MPKQSGERKQPNRALLARQRAVEQLQHFARPLPPDETSTFYRTAEMIASRHNPACNLATTQPGELINQAVKDVQADLLAAAVFDQHGHPNHRLIGVNGGIDPDDYEYDHATTDVTACGTISDNRDESDLLAIPARAVIDPRSARVKTIAAPEAGIPGAEISSKPGTTFYCRRQPKTS